MLPSLLPPSPSLTPLLGQELLHECHLMRLLSPSLVNCQYSPQSHPYTHSEWPLFCNLRKNHPTVLPLGTMGNVLRKPHHL